MAVEKNLPLEPLWQKVLAKTDGILPKDAVNQWISRIMPVALENGELALAGRRRAASEPSPRSPLRRLLHRDRFGSVPRSVRFRLEFGWCVVVVW